MRNQGRLFISSHTQPTCTEEVMRLCSGRCAFQVFRGRVVVFVHCQWACLPCDALQACTPHAAIHRHWMHHDAAQNCFGLLRVKVALHSRYSVRSSKLCEECKRIFKGISQSFACCAFSDFAYISEQPACTVEVLLGDSCTMFSVLVQ